MCHPFVFFLSSSNFNRNKREMGGGTRRDSFYLFVSLLLINPSVLAPLSL